MAFVQVIDYATSKPEEVERILDEWLQATEGKRNAKRLLRTRYRDESQRFCDIVFFDSYDEAMENSELPETQEFSKRLTDAIDGEPTYFDLDVLDDRQL